MIDSDIIPPEPNPMRYIEYRNWFYKICDLLQEGGKDMEKTFNDFIEKTKRYSWIDMVDRKGNILDIKINYYYKDIFNISILEVEKNKYGIFIGNDFYNSINTSDINLLIKHVIKIVTIRNYDLIYTYKAIGVDLITY